MEHEISGNSTVPCPCLLKERLIPMPLFQAVRARFSDSP